LKIGDLVKPLEDVPLAYDWYYSNISVGVITGIVNSDIKPELIEVMWNDGTTHKVYTDDVEKVSN
jgi:hypothetical protein